MPTRLLCKSRLLGGAVEMDASLRVQAGARLSTLPALAAAVGCRGSVGACAVACEEGICFLWKSIIWSLFNEPVASPPSEAFGSQLCVSSYRGVVGLVALPRPTLQDSGKQRQDPRSDQRQVSPSCLSLPSYRHLSYLKFNHHCYTPLGFKSIFDLLLFSSS